MRMGSTCPEGTSKLYEEVVQMPMAPTPSTLPSFSLPALMASWGVLYSQVIEEKKAQAWFTDGSARYVSKTWKWRAIAPKLLSGTSLKESEGISSKWIEL